MAFLSIKVLTFVPFSFFFHLKKSFQHSREKAYKSRMEKGKNLCLMTYESTQNP